MSRPTRTAAEIAESRATIVAAAARVMAQTGYKGATVQAIAAEAGCSAPTLYNYFCGKDDILRGMVEQVMERLMWPFAAPVDQSLAVEPRITALMSQIMQATGALRDIMIAFARLTAEACNAIVEGERMDGERLMTSAYVTWVEANLTEGERGGLTAKDAAYLLHGIGHSFFLRWMHDDMEGEYPAGADLAAAYFCKAVRP